jgi:hypothetical protein
MITPTIGRKVWYWPVNERGITVYDEKQACDATIIFVHGDTSINATVIDHAGVSHYKAVTLYQGSVEDRPTSSCATWMPYQQDQAKKHEG